MATERIWSRAWSCDQDLWRLWLQPSSMKMGILRTELMLFMFIRLNSVLIVSFAQVNVWFFSGLTHLCFAFYRIILIQQNQRSVEAKWICSIVQCIFYLKEIDCRIIAVWDVVSIQRTLVKIHQRIAAIFFGSFGFRIWQKRPSMVTSSLDFKQLLYHLCCNYGYLFWYRILINVSKRGDNKHPHSKISLRFRFGSCSRQRFRISLNTTWWSSARKHYKIELYSFTWFFVLTLYICIFEHSFVIYTSIIHITKPKHLIFINVAPGA